MPDDLEREVRDLALRVAHLEEPPRSSPFLAAPSSVSPAPISSAPSLNPAPSRPKPV